MKSSIEEWILKSRNDLKLCAHELSNSEPVTEAICFHSQQCCEKILKAFLIINNFEIRKTHDLSELITKCLIIDSDFKKLFEKEIDFLTQYAVSIRYPFDMVFPDITEAREAFEKAEFTFDFTLNKINNIIKKG